MMGDNCGCCGTNMEDDQCAFCSVFICGDCYHNLKTCEHCGEYDLCPKCIKPGDHDCEYDPADIVDADEEEE